ncbi:MAG: hypothetical protein ACPG4T_16950 [Nannocystaceae bacterium]
MGPELVITEIPQLVRSEEASFWMDFLAGDDLLNCQRRATAARINWLLRQPDILVVRVPVPVESGLAEASSVVPLIRKGLRGLCKVIERPDVLRTLDLDRRRTVEEPFTVANTDARKVEEALLAPTIDVSARERVLIQMYLQGMSKVQDAYRVARGDGRQTLRFVEAFWDLGDVGVANKFAGLAARLGGKQALLPEPGPPKRTTIGKRLETLEERLRRLGQ